MDALSDLAVTDDDKYYICFIGGCCYMMMLFSPLDLRHLIWAIARDSSGSSGSFLKSEEIIDGIKYYYKMSSYNSIDGFWGFESINEVICKNIANALGYDCLQYELIQALVVVDNKEYTTWLTRSASFKQSGMKSLSFGAFYDLKHMENEDPITFLKRIGYGKYLYDMLTLDYLVCNRDRHSSNLEILFKNGNYNLALLFDHGLSLMCSCRFKDDFEKFDISKSGPVNNFIGSKDLIENLKYVPRSYLKELSYPKDIFKGIDRDSAPDYYWGNIQHMFDWRFEYVKNL